MEKNKGKILAALLVVSWIIYIPIGFSLLIGAGIGEGDLPSFGHLYFYSMIFLPLTAMVIMTGVALRKDGIFYALLPVPAALLTVAVIFGFLAVQQRVVKPVAIPKNPVIQNQQKEIEKSEVVSMCPEGKVYKGEDENTGRLICE